MKQMAAQWIWVHSGIYMGPDKALSICEKMDEKWVIAIAHMYVYVSGIPATIVLEDWFDMNVFTLIHNNLEEIAMSFRERIAEHYLDE